MTDAARGRRCCYRLRLGFAEASGAKVIIAHVVDLRACVCICAYLCAHVGEFVGGVRSSMARGAAARALASARVARARPTWPRPKLAARFSTRVPEAATAALAKLRTACPRPLAHSLSKTAPGGCMRAGRYPRQPRRRRRRRRRCQHPASPRNGDVAMRGGRPTLCGRAVVAALVAAGGCALWVCERAGGPRRTQAAAQHRMRRRQ
eukprot:355035-Chlamydomonas_euryale.AAC.3